jgi:hypothetical protein
MDIQPSQFTPSNVGGQNNFTPSPVEGQSNRPTKKGVIKFGLSIAIIIICLVAAGVAVYWIKTEPVEQPESNIKISKPTDETAGIVPSPANGNGVNSVEGWQTYRNEEYGYEIKYPNDWQMKLNSDSVNISIYKTVDGVNYYINIVRLSKKIEVHPNEQFNLESWVSKQVQGAQKTTINGIPAFVFIEPTYSLDGKAKFIYVDNEDNIFWIRILESAQNENQAYLVLLNQILSTFKFTLLEN